MHIYILLLTLQIVLGINGDKLPPGFERIEATAEIFSALSCTKEEPASPEELQAMFKEAAEEKQKYLKERTPNELELEKIQEEVLKKLQSTPESAGATTAAKPATPDTAAKPATPDTAAKPASSPVDATKPTASTVPAATPGATAGTPKSGKLLRRARVRLARRGKYTMDPPFLKKGEVIKVKDMKFIPGDRLVAGAVGQVVKAQMTTKKDPNPVTVVMKAVPRFYAGDQDHAPGTVTERYLSLKAEYDALLDIYIRQPFAGHFLIKPIHYQEEEHRAFMVLEYAEGGALVDYMPNDLGKLRLTHRAIIKQIIYGVLTIHRSRYGHRDLKPDNIFVRKTPTGDFVPVVADLGNATPLDSIDYSQTGTALYAAPEYWLNFYGAVDFKQADAFSVGAIFYAMIFQDFPSRQDLNVPNTQSWGAIKFDIWDFVDNRIDPVAADFVQRLCFANPKRRMTLEEALVHPYLNRDLSFEDYIKSLGDNPWWNDRNYRIKVLSYALKERKRIARTGPIPQPRPRRATLRLLAPNTDSGTLVSPTPVGTIASTNDLLTSIPPVGTIASTNDLLTGIPPVGTIASTNDLLNPIVPPVSSALPNTHPVGTIASTNDINPVFPQLKMPDLPPLPLARKPLPAIPTSGASTLPKPPQGSTDETVTSKLAQTDGEKNI